MEEAVSVLIPTYNREKYIGECLESIFQQSYKSVRIIVYDDGSVDNTLAVVRTFAVHRIIEGAVNRGVSYARNRLLEACDTRFAAWQDSDDVSNIYRIEEQYQAILESGAPLAYCYHAREGVNVSPNWTRVPVCSSKASGISLGGSMFHAERCKAILFDEAIDMGGEDFIWRMAIEKRIGPPVVVNKVLYYIRQHPDRIGRKKGLPENSAKKEKSDLAYAAALQLLKSN